MEGAEIRRRFLRHFEEREHTIVLSSSLIPGDPSLLLTTAGMVQFKPYFLGEQEPPYPRAASAQKSFRTTDIDLVGRTDRHLTFFEMLGNFSFGDYFKEEAVRLAWDLVTEAFGLDPERLWATVYETDDEAEEIWKAYLPADRIVRRGKADNFWSMGVAGPCGPCSEIYVDRGPEHGREGGPEVDEDRFLEIWNLVFMQNECDAAIEVAGDLPRKNIDTGMGLERMAVILQGAASAFETDLMRPLLEEAERLADRRYGADEAADVSLRILAEHGRATTFLIADGVVPSNEGRGYVLRRMLRRVVSHARRLGVRGEVLPGLVERTVELLGEAYPELVERRAFVLQVATSEEEHFGRTLTQGMELFEREAARVREAGERSFPGEAAFLYHDTYGFPVELTQELAREHGLEVDEEAFERLMGEQRSRGRESAKGGVDDRALVEVARSAGRTEFVGYGDAQAEGTVVGLVRDHGRLEAAGEGDEVELILDRTPFYAEGGGQVGDAGSIRTETGLVAVFDTARGPGEIIVHRGRVAEGEVRAGQEAHAEIDVPRREATARSHTGTHVLHWTLRHLLGEHARQAGSLVAPGRLRFDFTHFEGLSPDLLEEVEATANARLGEDSSVRAYETTFEYARSQGALALFGERYGDMVRVVEIGDYSVELCGGTHVAHTGEVSLMVLDSEGSIGSGLRRVEALVGPDALAHVHADRRFLEELTEILGAQDPGQAVERARRAVAHIKELEGRLGTLRQQERGEVVDALLGEAADVGGVSLVVARLDEEPGVLREMALKLRDRLQGGPAAAVLGTADGRKATLVAAATPELLDRGVTAPGLLEDAARAVGGGAGGKDHLAFAGGGSPHALDEALRRVPDRLLALLGG